MSKMADNMAEAIVEIAIDVLAAASIVASLALLLIVICGFLE